MPAMTTPICTPMYRITDPERSRTFYEALGRAIPSQARDGLMRAWLQILRERHPRVSWIAVADWMTCEDGPPSTEAPMRRTRELATV
jgi:hypothetical protein